MTKEQYNKATDTLAEIALLEHNLRNMERDRVNVGYLFNEDEIKARKAEKIQQTKQQIQQLKQQFEAI